MPDMELLADDELLLSDEFELFKEEDQAPVVAPKNAEEESKGEMSEVLKAFRARAKNESARFEQATDSEYWVALCFQTRDQKEEFLRKINVAALGDKYLDGLIVAEALGIAIESPTPPKRSPSRSASWDEFIMQEEDLL